MSDRHIRRTGSDYGQAYLSLLPQGQAWPKHAPDSVLVRACIGLNDFWGEVDRRAADLLEQESDPRKTIELLPDWERNWGLPDPCYEAPLSIAERQLALIMRMTMQGAQSREFFDNVAAQIGYAISITEYRTFVVGIDRVGDSRVYGSLVPTPPSPPLIVSPPSSATSVENTRLALPLVSDQYVEFSLTGGADLRKFEISGSTLRWLGNGTKNFEAPDDADGNNTYIVVLRATAVSSGLYTEQTVTVTVADAAGDWQTAFSHPFTAGVSSSGWSGKNIRQRLPNLLITQSGDSVRLTLLSGLAGGEGLHIADLRIGYAAASGDAFDSEGPIVPLLVGGSPTFTIPVNAEQLTDPAAFPLDASRDLIISAYFQNPAADTTRAVALTGAMYAWKVGAAETDVENVSGYATNADSLILVKKIEVFAGTRSVEAARPDAPPPAPMAAPVEAPAAAPTAAPTLAPTPAAADDPIMRNEWGNPIMNARGDAYVPVGELSEWPYYGLGPHTNRFYWTVHVAEAKLIWFRCSAGQCGVDPHLRIGLADDLECLLDRWKPAHTEIIFDYSGLETGGDMAGTP